MFIGIKLHQQKLTKPYVGLMFSHISGCIRNPNYSYRLPTSIVPLEYIVNLQPDLDELVFNGSIQINFKVTPTTKQMPIM